MQPITSYAASDAFLRLLLQGPPGSGKTATACRFPGAYIADCDLNLGGPLRFLRDKSLPLPVGYDTIDRDETGKEVPMNMRYERLISCLQKAASEPSVQTIVVDSATKLSDYIIAHTLRQQNKLAMEIQSWGFYLDHWKKFVGAMTVIRKNFVLICHERVEKDEVDGSLKYFLNIPGQFGNMAGSLFTDVWRCEVEEKPGIPPTYAFRVKTMPSYRYNLKNSLGLPPVFEFDWKLIEDKLKEPAK